jgi:hypothetical protein
MSLQDKLDKIKKEFEADAPPEALAIMHRETDDLLDSGIIKRTLKAGDRTPEFRLPNEKGQMIVSLELLLRGPLVLSFYRGVW